jgi:hypothetical protein
MEDMNYSLEGFLNFAVISSKFCESASLLLEDLHDRVYGIAIFELPSEGMAHQFHPCLLLIALQSGIEEHLTVRVRKVTHFTSE